MVRQVAQKSADPGIVEQVDIYSNVDPSKTVSLVGGLLSFSYIESIMSDTIKVNLSFSDSGDSIDDKTVTEGLPLVGQEKVVIKFSSEYFVGTTPLSMKYLV